MFLSDKMSKQEQKVSVYEFYFKFSFLREEKRKVSKDFITVITYTTITHLWNCSYHRRGDFPKEIFIPVVLFSRCSNKEIFLFSTKPESHLEWLQQNSKEILWIKNKILRWVRLGVSSYLNGYLTLFLFSFFMTTLRERCWGLPAMNKSVRAYRKGSHVKIWSLLIFIMSDRQLYCMHL